MIHSFLLFLAPGASPEPAIPASRVQREAQASPAHSPAKRRSASWAQGLRTSAGVVANAAGFIALIGCCWLLLPTIATLIS
ncbi:hypothetical protein [Elongatibacter sediminis]|uniref:hypothetical protein n=1 Tax=Elongatibacter sediminis TaxID=3119006 RepID=UPI00339D5707